MRQQLALVSTLFANGNIVIFMWFWQQEDPQNTSYFPWYATMALTKLIAGPASRMQVILVSLSLLLS